MDFVPLLAAAAIVMSLVNLLKHIRAKDWNSVTTQLVSWGAGLLVAWMLAESDFAESVKLGDTGFTLGNVNGFSLVLFGLTFGAAANVLTDGLKAIDGNDSQKKPPLIPPST